MRHSDIFMNKKKQCNNRSWICWSVFVCNEEVNDSHTWEATAALEKLKNIPSGSGNLQAELQKIGWSISKLSSEGGWEYLDMRNSSKRV